MHWSGSGSRASAHPLQIQNLTEMAAALLARHPAPVPASSWRRGLALSGRAGCCASQSVEGRPCGESGVRQRRLPGG